MAEKITLKKLGIKDYQQDYEICNFNNININVKTYLPIEDTLNLIADTINLSADVNKFYNPGKLDAAFVVCVIKYYTDIELSDEEYKNVAKTYDLLMTSGLYSAIKEIIEEELQYVKDIMLKTVESIYQYNNSAMGVMETITQDYDNLNLSADEITEKLSNKENLTLLKDVMTKLG